MDWRHLSCQVNSHLPVSCLAYSKTKKKKSKKKKGIKQPPNPGERSQHWAVFLSKDATWLFCQRGNAGQCYNVALPHTLLHHGRREVAERKMQRISELRSPFLSAESRHGHQQELCFQMTKQDQALPQTQQRDALCIPSCRQGKQMLILASVGACPCHPPPGKGSLGMEEAFPFSPLPLNPGNAASTEPITAERMVCGWISEEQGWVAKRGTFSWQGCLMQQCCCRGASPSIHTGPCHRQKELLEKQTALGNEKIQQQRR